MSVLEGLSAYKARKDAEEARREQAAKPRVNRIALAKDGDSVVGRFGQEIDPDATNYNADRGIGFVNIEHNHPDPTVGWRNRANCSTESQGACLPCEKVADQSQEWDQRKGWKQKEKFYINFIAGLPKEVKYNDQKGVERTKYVATDIDRKTGDGAVYLLEQGTYNGIWDALAAYALDEDSGATIVNNFFKITRKGNNFNDTSYVLTPLKEIPADAVSLDKFNDELIDIKEDILTEVPYGQQEAFYYKGLTVAAEAPAAPQGEPALAGATSAAGTGDGW